MALHLRQVRKNADHHCYSKASRYQIQNYSFNNVEIQHKFIAEVKTRKRSLFHKVIICFMLDSVYDYTLKYLIVTGKDRQISL